MSDPKTQQEPSMEEILASIRRIISEDNQNETAAAPAGERARDGNGGAAPADEDVIELTEVIEEVPSPAAHGAHAAAMPVEPPVLDMAPAAESHSIDPPPEAHEHASAHEPVEHDVDPLEIERIAASVEPDADLPHDDRVISDRAADAAMRAFGPLSSALRGPGAQAGLPLGEGSRTIEDIVRDLLRPMLREWLDANLPELVQRIVTKEVREMVRRAEDV